MSPDAISAVMTHLPQATVVFNHFHILKLYNGRLSDLRGRLYHEAKTVSEKEALQATRWLLLKNMQIRVNRPSGMWRRLLEEKEIHL